MFCDMLKIPVSPSAWTFSMEVQVSPPNSIPLMRLVRLIQSDHPDLLFKVTDKLFRQVFAEGDAGILSAKPEALARVLADAGIKQAQIQQLLDKANSADWKNKLKDEAKGFVEKDSAYGVPHMRFTKPDGSAKDFMGSDRFELIAHWCASTLAKIVQMKSADLRM